MGARERTKVGVLIAAAALVVPAGGAAQARPDEETVRALHDLGSALVAESSLPGLAIAVGDTAGVAWEAAWGVADLEQRAPATATTRWRIGSVGKPLTAVGAVLLAERGLLDLDAPARSLLPALDGRPIGAVTPRQLAGHLGGVRHYREGEYVRSDHFGDVVDALDLFVDDSLLAAPGEAYEYSTHGYTLLSALVQAAAEEPFLDWMEAAVFRAAGMRSTGPDDVTALVPGRAAWYAIRDGRLVPAAFTDNSYKWAGGGLLSTPGDLVRFAGALLDGELVSGAGLDALFAPMATSRGESTRYGLGFRPREDWEGRRVVHHGGSSEGGRAFLLAYPDRGVSVAMASNRSNAPLFEQEAQTVAHFFLEHGGSGEGRIDGELSGAWSFAGTHGDDPATGALTLWDEGGLRGMLDWSDEQAPIRVVVVDRHGADLRLVGVGVHGVMNMWLSPGGGGAWEGRWDYLGRGGQAGLVPVPAAAAAGGDR